MSLLHKPVTKLLKLEDILIKHPVASALAAGSAIAGLSLQDFMSHNQDFGRNPLKDAVNIIFHLGAPVAFGALNYYASKRAKEADRDALTGAYSRLWYEKNIAGLASEAKAKGNFLGIFYLDLDGFKPVNEKFGHIAGDFILKNFVRILVRSGRAEDSIVRMGGDEFIVIVPCKSDLYQYMLNRFNANTQAYNDGKLKDEEREKKQREKGQPIEGKPALYRLSFSHGYVLWNPDSQQDIRESVRIADSRMLDFKREHHRCR